MGGIKMEKSNSILFYEENGREESRWNAIIHENPVTYTNDRWSGSCDKTKLKRIMLNDEVSDVVFFDVPSDKPPLNRERIAIFWSREWFTWAAINKYVQVNEDYSSSTLMSGCYKIEGKLAHVLLEAYGVRPEDLEGIDASRLPPSELERIAVESKKAIK
ncbi:MAG: hypothetical protein KKE20_07215 [Nanoarchaeota archaeon]|nr:hypothetical protein [Nanoarchaeota archaeon]